MSDENAVRAGNAWAAAQIEGPFSSAKNGMHPATRAEVIAIIKRLNERADGSRCAEEIAAAFHANYERLAPSAGYETRKASAVAWEDVPENNKTLMVATVAALLDAGVIQAGGASR